MAQSVRNLHVISATQNKTAKSNTHIRRQALPDHDAEPSLNEDSECRRESGTAATSPCSLAC